MFRVIFSLLLLIPFALTAAEDVAKATPLRLLNPATVDKFVNELPIPVEIRPQG